MIDRKYGRRNRSLSRRCSESNGFPDVDTDCLSQECPQDVYDFTYSSQGSTQCHWPDSYGFNSSQESRQLTIFGARKGGECEDSDGDLWKPKKVKLFDVDSGPNGSNSSQGTRELAILPGTGGHEEGVFEFSDGDFWKSKKAKNVDLDSYGLNSTQESGELGVLPSRKSNDNWISWDCGGISGKYKKVDNKENGVLQKNKNKNNKKKAAKSKELGSDVVELPATLMETQEFGEMMEHMDEVNFALDGLKKGQPIRTRRASLLSFLSICGTAQQRRLLRVHGYLNFVLYFPTCLIYLDNYLFIYWINFENFGAMRTLYYERIDDYVNFQGLKLGYVIVFSSFIGMVFRLCDPPVHKSSRNLLINININKDEYENVQDFYDIFLKSIFHLWHVSA